jgi:ybaK/ebsC protein
VPVRNAFKVKSLETMLEIGYNKVLLSAEECLMAKSSIEKTNVMRLLDQKKVPYTPHTYPHGDDAVDGVTVAQMTGMDPAKVFKTLVARGASKTPYVFVIPVARELDLKKAAKAVGEKSIAMLHVSELTPLTGYVRGGCSPVGMKKQFRTVFAAQALAQETILVSAGKIGYQVETAPQALIALVRASTADLTIEES